MRDDVVQNITVYFYSKEVNHHEYRPQYLSVTSRIAYLDLHNVRPL